jgi:hypothetical protein
MAEICTCLLLQLTVSELKDNGFTWKHLHYSFRETLIAGFSFKDLAGFSPPWQHHLHFLQKWKRVFLMYQYKQVEKLGFGCTNGKFQLISVCLNLVDTHWSLFCGIRCHILQ